VQQMEGHMEAHMEGHMEGQMEQKYQTLRAEYDARVQSLEEELRSVQAQADEWKQKAEASMPVDMGSFSSASPGEAALRMRLAKAEAAVEAERQAYQSLERDSRQWQHALDENESLRRCVLELREKEKSMEQYIETLQRQGAGVSQVDQASEARIRDMQIELDQSSQTITRLSGEMNELVARLKDQSRVIEEMKQKEATVFDQVAIDGDAYGGDGHRNIYADGHDLQGSFGTAMPTMPTMPTLPTMQAMPAMPDQPSKELPPPPSEEREAASLFDLIDQHQPVVQHPPPMAPPPFNPSHEIPAPSLPEPPLLPPAPHLPSIQQQQQQQQQQHEPAPQPAMPWAIPGGDAPSPRAHAPRQPPPESAPPKKSVGFWGWIAGADRVVDQHGNQAPSTL
jgi:hypothetical protein